MNKCKNPECQKEIPENKKFCNEECLRRFRELKNKAIGKKEEKNKPIQLIQFNDETINEIIEICDVFGFKHTDGVVSGSHNATILGYLRQRQEEVYSTTVDKLTWLCHMSARYLKENYLKGIEAFGIIETYTNEFGVVKWKWVGIKALRDNGSEK
jgi:predicted nucleic acid-binding Zn ribbon protein